MEISVKIMADVVESFLGAVVLDRGLKEVEKFLQAHLFPKLSVSHKIFSVTYVLPTLFALCRCPLIIS